MRIASRSLLALLMLTFAVGLVAGPGSGAAGAGSIIGNDIAFISDRDGNFEIYVMNADGSAQARLTSDPAFDGGPAWSPDGSKIAFRSLRDGNSEIYVMNADGSGQTNLTNHPADDEEPAWNPLDLLGDVNCDHAVTIADAQLIAQLIVGRISGLACAKNGDVNESDGVTIADAQLIAQLIVGRISSLPPP